MNDNEGVRVIDVPRCYLCGGEGTLLYADLRDRLFSAPGIWNLMRCPTCELVWIDPQPYSADMGKLYEDYFHDSEPTKVSKKSSKRPARFRKYIKPRILASGFGYYQMGGKRSIVGSMLSLIGPLKDIVGSEVMWLEHVERGRLLDVGCGTGRFLNQMRQLGWEVTGVEPDVKSVSVARDKYGLEVFQGSMEERNYPEGHFDAITVHHVIEHVTDPVALLKECHRTLKPGGKLVIVTPNIKSLGRRMFDEAWVHWDPPRHLHLFSPQTLREYAEAARLNIQELRTTAAGSMFVWVASFLIYRDGRFPTGGSPWHIIMPLHKIQAAIFILMEYGLPGRWKVGEELVAVAVK